MSRVCVLGLGYVGLSLAITFAKKGFHVLGPDIDPREPELLQAGKPYLEHIPAERFFPARPIRPSRGRRPKSIVSTLNDLPKSATDPPFGAKTSLMRHLDPTVPRPASPPRD